MSDGIWPAPQKAITVHGFPWCLHERVIIGRRSLTTNRLCKRHNELLGEEVDREGIKLVKAFRESIGDAVTSEFNREHVIPKSFCFDGPQLERWFLKTTINLCITGVSQSLRWMGGQSISDNPPPDFVAAAFGKSTLSPPMGLYTAGAIGQNADAGERIEFSPLMRADSIEGGMFTIMGFRFLLFMGNEALPNHFKLPIAKSNNWSESYIARHQASFSLIIRGAQHTMEFLWK